MEKERERNEICIDYFHCCKIAIYLKPSNKHIILYSSLHNILTWLQEIDIL